MMRLCKTLFLVLLLALVVTCPVFGQTTPASDAKTANSEVASSTVAAAQPPETSAPGAKSVEDTTRTPTTDKTTNTTNPPSTAANSPKGPQSNDSTANTASSGMDGATYQVRLRDLEQRIDELKEQIRRSHTRLSLLSETILSGGTGGARAEISFINDMSSAFRMTQALFVLDGAVQYNKQDETGVLAGQKEIPIFSGSIPPEKGDVTTPIEQRPAVRYHKNIKTGLGSGAAPGSETKGGAADVRSTVSVSAGSK
jgi:hypothetical protein